MPIEIVDMIHAGVRIDPADESVHKAKEFYAGLLGLEMDKERPVIPGIPGFWSNIRRGDRTKQIHIMGAEGRSPAAKSEKHDPTRAHIAFTVADLEAARDTLEVQGVEFWEFKSLVGNRSEQLFFEDPFGNMIELQQAT